MSANSLPRVPVADIDLCLELEGRRWQIGQTPFRFNSRNYKTGTAYIPYPVGAEGYAYHITNQTTGKRAIFKLFKRVLNEKRLRRIEWLISQQLWEWDESFLGAPRDWVSTKRYGRPEGFRRDIAGVWIDAVPGSTWLDCKEKLCTGKSQWPYSVRVSLVSQLVRTLAVLERNGMIHGDLSAGNIMIDVSKPKASLYVIDFDAFVLKRPTSWLGSKRF